MVRQRTGRTCTPARNASPRRFRRAPFPLAIIRVRSTDSSSGFQRKFQSTSPVYPPEQLLQKTDGRLATCGARHFRRATRDDPADGRLREKSCALRRSDGSTRQVVLSTEPLSLGATPCLLRHHRGHHRAVKTRSPAAPGAENGSHRPHGRRHRARIQQSAHRHPGRRRPAAIRQPQPASTGHALLDQIMQASQRAATFTRQLLAFSRKQVLQPRVLNLSELVSAHQKNVEPAHRRKI